MDDKNQLRSAIMFAQISKLILPDEKLLKFFGVKDNSNWNDSSALETKTRVINNLRKLACQQQELLKYCDTRIQDIRFDAVKHMNILDDCGMILLYTKSRLLFNERELLAKKKDTLHLTAAMQYVNALQNLCKVVAIFPSTEHCTVDLLPAMETKEFWKNRSVLRLDNVSYFPTFIGCNITLGSEMLQKGNIVVAL